MIYITKQEGFVSKQGQLQPLLPPVTVEWAIHSTYFHSKYGIFWGQLNKTFTSVAIVLEFESNSYTCTLHL